MSCILLFTIVFTTISCSPAFDHQIYRSDYIDLRQNQNENSNRVNLQEFEKIQESTGRTKAVPFYIPKRLATKKLSETDSVEQIKKLLVELSKQIDLLEGAHMDKKNLKIRSDVVVPAKNDLNYLNIQKTDLIKVDGEDLNRPMKNPQIGIELSKNEKNALQSKEIAMNHSEEGNTNGRKWGPWTDWSACSVTCGKGREIRWRHCISPESCDGVETEMAEKTCQLPACSPGKFFGIFT